MISKGAKVIKLMQTCKSIPIFQNRGLSLRRLFLFLPFGIAHLAFLAECLFTSCVGRGLADDGLRKLFCLHKFHVFRIFLGYYGSGGIRGVTALPSLPVIIFLF